ncbi:MAG: hypothetical protein K8E66_03115 [Phycisphaerales bacterium]|nr:hypothetical protein [Phycisphaerales bacterium]
MRPRCHKCGYDLSGIRGTDVETCPECGVEIDWSLAQRHPIDRDIWWQIGAMVTAYGLVWIACFVPWHLPRHWANNTDPLVVVAPFFYGPPLPFGIILSVLGYVSRRRKRPRPRATWTWISTGLVTLFFLGLGVWVFWAQL